MQVSSLSQCSCQNHPVLSLCYNNSFNSHAHTVLFYKQTIKGAETTEIRARWKIKHFYTWQKDSYSPKEKVGSTGINVNRQKNLDLMIALQKISDKNSYRVSILNGHISFFFIWVWWTCNIVFVSDVQHSNSVLVKNIVQISEEKTPERMKGWSQSKKKHPGVDVTGDRSKIRCCKEQYCIGTWNVRSMNQGKLEVVKQDGKSERRHFRNQWTKVDWNEWEFNSDDHCIYDCGQESLRRNGVAIIVNNRVQNAVLGCNLKNDRMISVHFQGKPFNITVIQVSA